MVLLTILHYDPTAFDYAFIDVMHLQGVIYPLLFHLFLVQYVYQDVEEPNSFQGKFWTGLVFCTNILGLILYFFITKEQTLSTRITAAFSMMNAFILLLVGDLYFFAITPSVAQVFFGPIPLFFQFVIILIILGSGICALWIGFQVIGGNCSEAEILHTLILASIGLFLICITLPTVIQTPSRGGGFIGVIGGMCLITPIYTLLVRDAIRTREYQDD